MSEQSVPSGITVAETFEKLAQALIAHAAALNSFAAMYRGSANAAPPPVDATPAPTTSGKARGKKADATPAAPAPTAAEVAAFAVAWIKEGATDAAQTAIKAQIVAISNKYGAQKIAELPTTALASVLAELQAAKSGAAAAPASSVIDI